MTKTKRLSVDLETNFYRRVKVKATSLGLSISTVVRRLLGRWLKGEIEAIDTDAH